MCATSRQRGIDALDLQVISHLDSDHSGGVASILAGMRVGAALTSIDAANPSLRGAHEVRRCEAGQGFALGAMRVDVLHPLAADYQRRLPSNAESCVLRVRLGPARLLLIGDLPAREESELAGREDDLFADWVLVPHHGSRSSSSAVLLDAARPRWAGVQAGYRNRFGHPDAQVVARYMARAVHIVRSDESGAAQWRFRSDGTVDLHRWRASAHRYWHNRPEPGAGGAEAADVTDAAPGGLDVGVAEPVVPY